MNRKERWGRAQRLLGCIVSLGATVGALCLLTADSALPGCEVSTYSVSYDGVTNCGGSFTGRVTYDVKPQSGWTSAATLTSGNLPVASPAGWVSGFCTSKEVNINEIVLVLTTSATSSVTCRVLPSQLGTAVECEDNATAGQDGGVGAGCTLKLTRVP
jgi:hypothetical protein